MPDEYEIFEAYLRSRNLNHSKPRDDILEVLLASTGHPSAQELHDQVRQKNPRIGFSTVYRNLRLLEECGLARSMDYGDGTQRYEPNRFQHHHIICSSCNRTVEFLSPELESLLRQAQQRHDFRPQSHAVRILSVCADCKKAAAPSSRHGTEAELEVILARDALEMAITNEWHGLHFYNHALEATRDPVTRQVFTRLAAEEKEHLEVLQAEFDNERLESIFPKGSEHIRQMVRSAKPTEALQAAMDAERRSYEFFRHYANQVDKPRGRAIFEQFADDEKRHLAVIREAYDELQGRGRP
jgi:Fur family ferric uptake transcriptional regulator